MAGQTRTIANGFAFPECPRWHEGRLYFSDQHAKRVHVLEEGGAEFEAFEVPGQPSGLGWLPNGDLIVVSMNDRCLYRRRDGALTRFADLAGVHAFGSNDMVVDAKGRAYVGNIGFDFFHGETPITANVAMVTPDGKVTVAAGDMMCPNGSVVTPDGKTLIVAESLAMRLTAFDIAEDGGLSGRRVWADLDQLVPDGICLDSEGCVWFAAPYASAVVRVREGGAIMGRVETESGGPYACMLGGADGRTLFIACAPDHDHAVTMAKREGRIDAARAPAPAAGWP